ncbi:hypothetical protein FRC00_014003 [Tulasnella sp. 408]|nr:hypothetical protein FRC00_014003 [Tulasnella sp. 408]
MGNGQAEETFSARFSKPGIVIPGLLVGTFGYCFANICAVTSDIEDGVAADALKNSGVWRLSHEPSSREMFQARMRIVRAKWQQRADELHEQLKSWPTAVAFHTNRLFVILANSWLWAGEGGRVAYGITAINAGVFLAWCIPRLRPFMSRHFTHNVLSGKTYTMLTSVFSHASLMHLGFNSLALISFSSAAWWILQDMQNRAPSGLQEATPKWHFLAFYVAAGLASSYVSHVAQASRLRFVLRNIARPERAAAAMKAAASIKPSLGASGAIYATVALTAFYYPNTAVNIMLIPIAVPIGAAVSGMVALDILGIIRGWQMFDHWAHLGGAAFGALAYWDGGRTWDWLKQMNKGKVEQRVKAAVEQMEQEHSKSNDA